MYCDTFELSFDVRCKVQSLAQRLAGISALYDKKRLSYAHSKLLTMVSKLGKTLARGACLTKKQQKNAKISLSISFRLLKMYCDTFELSFDVRCKAKFFARRLAGIAALYDKKWLGYARLNLLTMVSNRRQGCVFFEKNAKM